MARNNRGRGNRGRGRNRGSLYAQPIAEPANFIEFDIQLVGGTPLTHANLNAALIAVIPQASISKYRVSSIVIDQGGDRASGTNLSSNVPVEVIMGISGNHYQASSSVKPLKIRLGKDYGDDGMWIVTDGAALSDAALPGNETTADAFITLEGSSTTGSEMHVRCAWTDPS